MEFQELISAKIKESGLTFKKLSELSGIAEKHLENLASGNSANLPPSPYLHGYFIKLGQVLGFDGEKIWESFQAESEISSSGPQDTLPKNRFIKKSSAKKIWAIAVIVIAVAYFGIRFSKIFGKPSLTIYYPETTLTVVSSSEITFRGQIKNGDKILINDEEVGISEDGLWFKAVPLQPGSNEIKVQAKKFLGLETSAIRQVSYELPPKTEEKEENSPADSSEKPTSTPETP